MVNNHQKIPLNDLFEITQITIIHVSAEKNLGQWHATSIEHYLASQNQQSLAQRYVGQGTMYQPRFGQFLRSSSANSPCIQFQMFNFRKTSDF